MMSLKEKFNQLNAFDKFLIGGIVLTTGTIILTVVFFFILLPPNVTATGPTITADELYQLINNNKANYTLVDVRDWQYYVDGHIPTAIWSPYENVTKDTRLLNLEKNHQIIFYCDCPFGGISKSATLAFQKMGYTNVSYLKGGTSAWTDAGYKLISGSEPGNPDLFTPMTIFSRGYYPRRTLTRFLRVN